MFKFVSKGDNKQNESALFYNGQLLYEVWTTVNENNGEVIIEYFDGNDNPEGVVYDYLEDYGNAD